MNAPKVSVALLSILLLGISARADSLIPPGAPGSEEASMKSLNQIEPRVLIESLPTVITNPGSYYVTANLYVTQDVSGITVLANDVQIDLNGFMLVGLGSGTNVGVRVPIARKNIKIGNGVLRQWGYDGIWAESGDNFHIKRISAVSNGWSGIWINAGGLVENCTSVGNTHDGIMVGPNSTIEDCTALYNKEDGIDASSHCRINDCTAMGNTLCGIKALGGTRIKGCTAGGNNTYGIVCGDASLVQSCVASGSKTNGIEVTKSCRVIACSARENSGNGIVANDGSIIRDCISSVNDGDGILVTSNCRVEVNNCTSNGQNRNAAGIHVTSDGNRIDSNNVSNNNNRGILVDSDAGKSILLRNTAHNNGSLGRLSDYDVPTTLPRGEVLDDLSGFLPVGRPWANFSY